MKLSVRGKRNLAFIKRLLKSPHLIWNTVTSFAGYKFKTKRAFALPVAVDLEPINSCNFRCSHCQVPNAKWERKSLDDELFSKMSKLLNNVLRLKLQGMGEPFLHKNLIKYIKAICNNDIWCEVITNGSLLDKYDLNEIDQFKNLQITVSFDAAEKSKFEEIRGGSDFDKIVKNLKMISKNTNLDLAAWMVVFETNRDHVIPVIKLLKEIGIDLLGLQFIVVNYGKEELNDNTVSQRYCINDELAFKKEFLKVAADNKMNIDIADKLYDRRNICPWPWLGVFVDSNGNIVPCCRIGDAGIINMGNIKDRDFSEIWNSTKYKKFRMLHKKNQIPVYCRSCYKN